MSEGHDLLRGTDLAGKALSEASAAVDIAQYDLRGQERGAPVSELLAEEYGTDPTTELPLNARAGMYMEPEIYVEHAEIRVELGFFGYKYCPGIGVRGYRRTLEALAEAIEGTEFHYEEE